MASNGMNEQRILLGGKKRKEYIPQKYNAEKECFEKWRFQIPNKPLYPRLKPKAKVRPSPTEDFVYYDFRHLLIGEDPKQFKAKYECTCGEYFKLREAFRAHITPKFQCMYCELEFLDKETYDGHRFFDHAAH